MSEITGRLTPEREAFIRDWTSSYTAPFLNAEIHCVELLAELDATRRERDEAHQHLMNFTGASTVDEALTVIIAPVEWDALASYHGVVIVGRTPTDEMVERAAWVMTTELCNSSWTELESLGITRTYWLPLARRALTAAFGGVG